MRAYDELAKMEHMLVRRYSSKIMCKVHLDVLHFDTFLKIAEGYLIF